MGTKKRYSRNKKYKSKKYIKKHKNHTKKYYKKHNKSTKKKQKRFNKKMRKGGTLQPLDQQQSCLIHSEPGCDQVTVPYDVNCNQFYELDTQSDDAIMCRNPVNHNVNRSLKKNIKCKSSSLRKPKIKYCSRQGNSGMKQQIEIELDEITKKIQNLNNFYNSIKSLVGITRRNELILDWNKCIDNSLLTKMFKSKKVSDYKIIFEELKFLETFLFGKEHPIQKMYWAWSEITPLKRKVNILENLYFSSNFIFLRLGYILNLHLLILTTNYILQNKNSISEDDDSDVEEFTSVITPYPSEEIEYFNQNLQPGYPIVNLLINVNGNFEAKLNNLERNISICIQTYLESTRDESLHGYYVILEKVKKDINSKNPATIRAYKESQRQKRRVNEAYRLGLDVEDLDDEEKVAAAEERYRAAIKKEQDKRAKRLYRAEQLRIQQEQEQQEQESSSADVNINQSESDLAPSEPEPQTSRGFFEKIGDRVTSAYRDRQDRLQREKEEEERQNRLAQEAADDEPWVPPSERPFDFAAY